MKREFLKNLSLSDEAIEKIMAEHGNSVNAIKNKQAELEGQIADYKTQLSERDKQLDSLKKAAGDSDALTKQIAELQAANKQAKAEFDERIETLAKENLVNLALTKAGAKNPKAVKALLNLENTKRDGDTIIGLVEQLDKLKETDSYLFHVEQKPTVAGTQPNSGSGAPADTPPPGSYEAFEQAWRARNQ
jgi:folylpolyglutamate synthase/dihydropteroate synthase